MYSFASVSGPPIPTMRQGHPGSLPDVETNEVKYSSFLSDNSEF